MTNDADLRKIASDWQIDGVTADRKALNFFIKEVGHLRSRSAQRKAM